MKRFLTAAAVVSALGLGCGKSSPPGTQGPQVTVVPGAPQALTSPPARHAVTGATAPSVVSTLSGQVAVGDTTGVFIGNKAIADTVDPITVVPTGTDPVSTGTVTFMARRSSGGTMVQAQNGLFHDDVGYLVFSPLTGSVSAMTPTTVDALGTEPAEELWFTSPKGVLHVSNGNVDTLDIQGAVGTPDAVVAAGPSQAIVVSGGSAYLVDLSVTPSTVTDVGDNLGTINGFDHGDDGTVYLATTAGLYTRTRAGAASLYTLAASGSPAVSVLSVTASYGTVMAATATQLVELTPTGPNLLGALAQGQTGRGVAVDTNGDGWAIDQGQLAHFLTGKPVTFAADVQPFFAKHCMVCHWTNASGATANGAPPTNFGDYATAVAIAPIAIRRLESDGYSPMPPPTANDPLTPSDYAVVIRWVGGGYQP